MPMASATSGDEPRDPSHLVLQRALIRPDPLRQRGDAAELGVASRSRTPAPRRRRRCSRPAEHEVGRLQEAARRHRSRSAERNTGTDSPVSVEVSTSSEPASRRASAEIPSPSAMSKTSPGTSSRGVDPAAAAVANAPSPATAGRTERLDRPLGLLLLGEREHGVHDDHGDDRDGENGRVRQPGEQCRRPQEQGQRVGELAHQLLRPRPPSAGDQLVRPGRHEAALRLTLRQSVAAGPKVSQQSLGRLAGVRRCRRPQIWWASGPTIGSSPATARWRPVMRNSSLGRTLRPTERSRQGPRSRVRTTEWDLRPCSRAPEDPYRPRKNDQEAAMRALVFHGPGNKAWEEVAKPTIQADTDAIVRVDAVTICGTDLHILKGDVPAVTDGRILGHEAVGTVAEIGTAVKNVRVGDKVLVSCITACGVVPLLPRRQLRAVPGWRWVDPRAQDRRHPGRVRAGSVRRHLHVPGAGGRERRGAPDARRHPAHRLRGRRAERSRRTGRRRRGRRGGARSACRP